MSKDAESKYLGTREDVESTLLLLGHAAGPCSSCSEEGEFPESSGS